MRRHRNAAAARDQYAALLPVRERVLGPEHPGTQTTRVELIRWTGKAADVPGPEHPNTLTAHRGLARWIGAEGGPADARDLFAALVPVAERKIGPEHARHELARWTGQAGDPAASRDLYAALLPVREQVSGPENAETLTARVNLAYWTEQARARRSLWRRRRHA